MLHIRNVISPIRHGVLILIYLLFFFSGAAALAFETLWFHQAALVLGNSVWASSTVLASFMCGLALGNYLIGRWQNGRNHNPLILYGSLEAVIGLTGALIVLYLPGLGRHIAPFLYSFESEIIRCTSRLIISFTSMAVPATCMGMTLPVLVKALTAHKQEFGKAIGSLYGLNTLGAVFGCLATELVLIEELGIRNTGLFVGFVNLSLCFICLLNYKKFSAGWSCSIAANDLTGAVNTNIRKILCGRWQFLLSCLLAGASLLSLEVIWFRFLQLFSFATSESFAVMLATVLAGISLGSVFAAVRMIGDRKSQSSAETLSIYAGAAVLLCYQSFQLIDENLLRIGLTDPRVLPFYSLILMFPVSFISGALFTSLAALYKNDQQDEIRAAGIFTLWNTVGAMLGSILGALAALPLLGIEYSIVIISLVYLAIWVLIVSASNTKKLTISRAASLLVFLIVLVQFPHDLMRKKYIASAMSRYTLRKSKTSFPILLTTKEGLTETLSLISHRIFDKPMATQLVTNGHSMTGSFTKAKRYMKLYAYLPAAMLNRPKDSLLISYGVGRNRWCNIRHTIDREIRCR